MSRAGRMLGESMALGAAPVPVRLRRSARARRLTLRLETGGDGAVLTAPPGVGEGELVAFLDRHRGWLERRLEERPARVVVKLGARVPVDGVERLLVAGEARRGPPQLDGDHLVLPGRAAAGPRMSVWLKERARARLIGLSRDFGKKLGRLPAGISLRDTRSRWGSCSSTGQLSFSWRLAMAPESVQAYVAAHEVAHLAEMNHQPRFWRTLERLMPEYEPPREWLAQHGRSLHRYRFDAADPEA